MYYANKPHFGGIISRYLTCNDHCPLPHTGSFNCPNWLGGGTEREDCQGGGDRVGGGKVKRQLYLRPVGTLVVRKRMGKALKCRVASHCQWVGAPAPLRAIQSIYTIPTLKLRPQTILCIYIHSDCL